jgi:uncharacterized protein
VIECSRDTLSRRAEPAGLAARRSAGSPSSALSSGRCRAASLTGGERNHLETARSALPNHARTLVWRAVSLDSLAIFCAALVAGMINSVAGGGTLVSFPALIWVGRDPIVANVTSTIGLWPASLGAMVGFRRELRESREWIGVLLAPSFAGGILGAVLLLRTPSHTFAAVVPYLILFATSLFAAGDRIAGRSPASPSPGSFSGGSWWAAVSFQFFVAVYGGYFGAGIGILMLAALSLFGLTDMHRMNGIKNTLAVIINGTAAIYFSLSGRVLWSDALLMAVGASVGGYGGAGLARALGQAFVRRAVVAIGIAMAVSLLWR